MKFLEADLEDLIYEASHTKEGRLLLYERGLPVESPMDRQLHLSAYGILDLLEVRISPQKDVHAIIYELKKDSVSLGHLVQLSRYMVAIRQTISRHCPFEPNSIEVTGRLIGTELKDGEWCMLYNWTSENLSIYTYDFSLEEGMTFKKEPKKWGRADADFGNIGYALFGDGIEEEFLTEANEKK